VSEYTKSELYDLIEGTRNACAENHIDTGSISDLYQGWDA